ncbi:MAG: CHAP domain-containing protein [Archangium sp.]|nr:CHAP domain-containing protein [Archangium sp.]
MRSLWLSAAFTLVATGCATGAPIGGRHLYVERYEPFARPAATREIPDAEADARAPLAVAPGARDTAVSTAQALLGKSRVVVRGKRYGDDCTSFVKALYEPLGVDLLTEARPGDNAVTAMWRFASHHGRIFEGGRPLPGDLVFFKETYDLNRDGHTNDGLTHVGLVEDVEADGTVLVIHRVARGVVRYRMNLSTPTQLRTASGKRLNDWLRTEAPGSKPRLTSELFAGFATLLPVESRLAKR